MIILAQFGPHAIGDSDQGSTQVEQCRLGQEVDLITPLGGETILTSPIAAIATPKTSVVCFVLQTSGVWSVADLSNNQIRHDIK